MFEISSKNGTAIYWEDGGWVQDCGDTFIKVIVAHVPGNIPKAIVFTCGAYNMEDKGERLIDAAAKTVLNDMDIPSYLAKDNRKWIVIS